MNLWQIVGVLADVTPSPSPTPGLREGLEADAVSPGFAGFVAVFAVALACLVLFSSLTGKLRKVRRRGELAEAEEAAADSGTGAGPGDEGPDEGR